MLLLKQTLKMKLLKLITITLIISAGLIGSYWIMQDTKQTTGETAGFSFEEAIKPGGTLFKYVEEAVQKITNKTDDSVPKNSFNLTKNLSQSIFEQIKLTNSSNQERVLSTDVDLILKNSQFNFNFISTINDANLKISQDNSRETKIKYLDTIREINKKELGNFNKNYLEVIIDVFQKLDSSSAIRWVNIYKNLANNYLNVTVPADWLDVHKKMIIYFKNSEIVYQAMASYLTDPIRGYLTLEIIEEMVVNDGQRVQNLLNEKIQKIEFLN